MMIIWGWGKVTKRFLGRVMDKECNYCNTLGGWQLCIARTWFTLFFIPVIPYKTVYCIICPTCGSYMEIDKERFMELKTALLGGESDAVKYAGKTPTQVKYLKEREEHLKNQQEN